MKLALSLAALLLLSGCVLWPGHRGNSEFPVDYQTSTNHPGR